MKMNEVFLERVKTYFPDRYEDFLAELAKKENQSFFLNTAKADRDAIFEVIDFPYEENPYSPDSFYHHENNIGKTRAYELGLIYPQDIAASLPARFVDTKDLKLVIDLCAAPGGKSINLLNRLTADPLYICNDVSHKRALTLSSNLERLGLDLPVVTCKKPSEFQEQFAGMADLVILDVPCSGEGMIRKYPEILDTYSIKNIENLASVQKELLENAYVLLNGEGQLLYSTCTFAFEEDEDQISAFLNRHPDMEVTDIDMPFSSKPAKTVKMSFLDGTEGQFFALLRKKGDRRELRYRRQERFSDPLVDRFIADNLSIDEYQLYRNSDHIYLSFREVPDLHGNVLRNGIHLGDLVNRRFEPAHSLYRANSLKGRYRHVCELSDHEYDLFISGSEIKKEVADAYYLLTCHGHSLGFGKAVNGTIKNKYPKGLRRMI